MRASDFLLGVLITMAILSALSAAFAGSVQEAAPKAPRLCLLDVTPMVGHPYFVPCGRANAYPEYSWRLFEDI